MKRTSTLILVLLLFSSHAFPQAYNAPAAGKNSKLKFDRILRSENSQFMAEKAQSPQRLIEGEVWEYSMMEYGYFTLGTSKGKTESLIDDNCELSFGHPYSLTSFAYPVIEGERFYPHEIISTFESGMTVSGDTLIYRFDQDSLLMITCSLYADVGDRMNLRYQIENIDGQAHSVGMGLLFDAALGKWGDGFIEYEGDMLDSVTILNTLIPDSLILWERAESPKGLGSEIYFVGDDPAEIVLGNWSDEYTGVAGLPELYDLAVHLKWDEAVLAPGESKSFQIRFTLRDPDVGDQAFLRWDMPNILSIENQILFPANLKSQVEILNNSASNSDMSLRIVETESAYGWESMEPFHLNLPLSIFYQEAMVNIPEIYDSVVIPVQLQLLKSGNVIDEISRKILVPEAPFSDEGLIVEIDTAYTTGAMLNMSFHCIKEETGQYIYQLHKNNVYLYDNALRIEDFSLGKDTTGGNNSADIVFVLDVTGSMSDEIAAVRDNIIEFTDSLSYRGIDYRLGMVTFLDVIENVYDFTDNVQEFQAYVSQQYAHGGGDRAENSLDALSRATQFNYRDNASRIIIWITDADFHISNSNTQETKESVIQQLLAEGLQVHCIGDPQFQTDYYDQIVMNTGGSFYDINGNFRDILLEVSRLHNASNHFVSFMHSETILPGDVFKVEVHYAGLGGEDVVSIGSATKSYPDKNPTKVTVLPNPFSDMVQLKIKGSQVNHYRVQLYNTQGQLLSTRYFEEGSENIQLNITDMFSLPELKSKYLYLLKIVTLGAEGNVLYQETIKISKL